MQTLPTCNWIHFGCEKPQQKQWEIHIGKLRHSTETHCATYEKQTQT